MARDLGGFRQCLIPGCGARVAIREDRAGRVYCKCLGHHDAKKCGAEIKFGKNMGETLRAEIETEKAWEASDDEPETSIITGRESPAAETDNGDQPGGAELELEPEPEPATGPASEPRPEHWSGL